MPTPPQAGVGDALRDALGPRLLLGALALHAVSAKLPAFGIGAAMQAPGCGKSTTHCRIKDSLSLCIVTRARQIWVGQESLGETRLSRSSGAISLLEIQLLYAIPNSVERCPKRERA